MPNGVRSIGVILLLVLSLVGSTAGPIQANHTGQDCSFPVTATDMTNTTVRLDDPAEEVVVLDPSSAQVFWELTASDRVVGLPVEDYTAYLAGAENRTDVTDGQQILVERVIELQPDLVIAPNYAGEATIRQLRESGLTVYQLGLEDSLEAIYQKTALYGHFIGACAAADATITDTRSEVAAVRTAVEGRDRPRVLYYFFGFTAGNDTFIHDLIRLAGGKNVAAAAGIEGYQEISAEVIVEADPEWIVTPSHAGLPEGEPYESTTAMETNQTLVVNENLVSQAAPRVVVPLRQMAEAFHPAAFSRQSPTQTTASVPARQPTRLYYGIAILVVIVVLVVGLQRYR